MTAKKNPILGIGIVAGRQLRLPHFVFALLLIFAAAGKTRTLFWSGDAWGRLVIAGELFLACWLALGIWSWASHHVATLVLMCFTLLSLRQVSLGADSCGCLGEIQVKPIVMMAVDAILLLSMAIMPPSARGLKSKRIFSWTSFAIGIACLFAYVLSTAAISAIKLEDRSAEFVYLAPRQWLGKSFSLDATTVPKINTSTGNWLVLLYRADCSKCDSAIAWLAGLDDEQTSVLILSTAGKGRSESVNDRFVYADLPIDRTWIVATPVLIEIRQGTVRRVWTADELTEFYRNGRTGGVG